MGWVWSAPGSYSALPAVVSLGGSILCTRRRKRLPKTSRKKRSYPSSCNNVIATRLLWVYQVDGHPKIGPSFVTHEAGDDFLRLRRLSKQASRMTTPRA